MSDLIEQIAKARGIANDYVDASGNKVFISRENKIECLKAMGYSVDNEQELAKQYASQQEAYYKAGCDPVVVTFENSQLEVFFRLTEEEVKTGSLSYTITLEDGSMSQGEFSLDIGSKSESYNVNGIDYAVYEGTTSLALPLGYHSINIKTAVGRSMKDVSVICCPRACYKPDSIIKGKKVWGPSVQLYTLRSEKNWGIGDFGDLADLIKSLADNGAGFVGVNPIHAAYPSDPESASPYSPSSRRWLNLVYINVENVPEFKNCKEALDLVNSPDFQAKLAALREREYVDYTGVMKLKMEVLQIIFENSREIFDKRSRRGKAFKNFCEEGGEALKQMAVYDAIMSILKEEEREFWGWPVWPSELQKYDNAAVKAWVEQHPDDVEFFEYLQFLADEQLAAADKVAKDRGMAVGIYRDLAVGVSCGSEEIWANGDIYCVKASIGAPPDPLGPLGQNWGLPPMDPTKLIERQYQPIIDLFRANMRHCGSLRIDHAMSLLRLWWVPPAAPAKQGAYIYYRVHDLVGILALESHRNKCLIIGEDLGTVPAEMKSILRDAGIHSYKIFFWEKASDGGFISPKDYVEQAMSALSTHDMPTIVGWWDHKDLELGKQLGLYTDEHVRDIGNARKVDQQRILDSLHWHGVIGDDITRDVSQCPISQELIDGMQIHMCLGNCALFSTQIEDWLSMDKPVNVPGTSNEYPNWRRKLSRNLSDIFSDKHVISLLRKMTEARSKVSKH